MKNFMLIFGILLLIGLAGSYDYTEQVVYNMPTGAYKAMKAKGMTDKDIAKEYQSDKAKWDSIGIQYTMIYGED
jgi:hypothetical protein